MARENLFWGAPKVHGELLKLGFTVSERCVSRYLRAVSGTETPESAAEPREAIVAMEFFTVATVSLRVLYCSFVIDHAVAGFCIST
jgi:hypothetical protein